MTSIGFIGIGLMGLPMCQRLLAAGFPLTVFNRNAEKCVPLTQAGATAASSIAELVARVDVIMICVSDTAAVQSVLNNGLLESLKADQVVIDFSSIEPGATREMATEVAARGAQWIDCPVSGGVRGAENGQLVMMAGGDRDALARVEPLLKPLSQRVTHMGPSGAGQVTKICNQMIVASNAMLIAEMVALAEKAGVDSALLAPALAGGFADSLPFQILTPRMSAKNFEPVQWRVQTLLKDLDTAVKLSREIGAAIPLAANASQLMRLHADKGHHTDDLSSVITLYSPPES